MTSAGAERLKEWHVPVDAEWTDLVAFLSEDAAGVEVEGWNEIAHWEVGQMLKSSCCWMPQNRSSVPGLSDEDAHGFNTLSGGERGFDGFFAAAGNYESGKWWSASIIEYELTRKNKIRCRYLDFRD